MTGETESIQETTKSIAGWIDEALAKYEGSIGLPKIQIHSEAEQYLNMNHITLRKLSAEDCGEAAVVLAQYGMHIQRAYNDEMARVVWCEEEIRRTITDKINNYRGASFEERKMSAVKGDDYATKVDKVRAWAKTRAEKLSYISSKVEYLSRTMLELQQTKRRQFRGDFNGNGN